MFSVGIISGGFFLVLYLGNIQSDQIFIICIKVTGICLCVQGILYLFFYFLNVPFLPLVEICYPERIRNRSRSQLHPSLAKLFQQSSWSDIWVASSSQVDRATDGMDTISDMVAPINPLASLPETVRFTNFLNESECSPRSTEIALVDLYHDC